MNNAKMTFRFDHGRNKSPGHAAKEQPKVIPLHQEEYRVIRNDNPHDQLMSDSAGTETAAAPTLQRGGRPPESFIDAQTLNQYTNDFGGWQSPFDAETQRIEKLIRESARGQQNAETGYIDRQQNHWDRGNVVHEEPAEPLKDHRWYVPEDTAYVTRSSGSSILKVAASVAGAIVTGIAFGFFVLSMFSDDSQNNQGSGTTPPAATSAATGAANGTATANPAGSNSTAAGQAAAASAMAPVANAQSTSAAAAVNIPGKTVVFLQSGVFSTPQAAETAQSELKKKGLAAVSDTGSKYPVYVGMTLSRDDALGLAQQFEQKNTEVIVKNIELPALTKIKWTSKPSEGLPSYLAQGDKLLQSIIPLTLARLSEAQPAALDAAAIQTVKTAHQTWTGLTQGANEGLAEDARALVQKMGNAMNTAVVSLEEYKKNPAPTYMWQAQNAMMQYVLAQKELRQAIAAP